jgi:hypothetical protein
MTFDRPFIFVYYSDIQLNAKILQAEGADLPLTIRNLTAALALPRLASGQSWPTAAACNRPLSGHQSEQSDREI